MGPLVLIGLLLFWLYAVYFSALAEHVVVLGFGWVLLPQVLEPCYFGHETGGEGASQDKGMWGDYQLGMLTGFGGGSEQL